jgi:polysaccharide biosynthesis/export protein
VALARQKWYKQVTVSQTFYLFGTPTPNLSLRAGFTYHSFARGTFVLRQLAFFIALVLCISYAELVSAQTNNYTDTTRTTERIASPEAKAEAKRLHKEGMKYGVAGLFSQAAEIFEQAVKLDPRNSDAHYSLAHAYFDMQQWKKAIRALERVVELNPRDQDARDRLSLARTIAHQGPERAPTRSQTAPQAVQVSMNVKPAPPPVKNETASKESTSAKSAAPPPVKSEPASKESTSEKSATPPPVKSEPASKESTSEKSATPPPVKSEPASKESTSVKSAPPPPPVKTETASNELKEAVETKETPEAIEAKANAAANDLALTKIYRVGPSDVLDIRVNDSSSPQSTLYTVTPAGLLEHPLLAEPLQAGGLTVDEISARFESELKRRALNDNPKVSVGVRDYASHTILVSGLVKDSGTKILRREAIPLYVVVADAQPLPEAASATVVRSGSSETFEIDLTQSSEMNLLVRPGDVITLQPNVTQFVYIGGEVKQPGEKTYRRGLTLTQAIIAAGGVTPKSKEARIGRDDGKGFLNVTQFKLKDIESGKIADPVIKPGDRIMIVE